jgi:integrase
MTNTNEEVLNKFKNYLKLREYSPVYADVLKMYLEYCSRNAINYLDVNIEKLNNFLLYCKIERKNGSNQINKHVKSLRFFYRYLREYSMIDENTLKEVEKLKLLRVENKIRPSVTIEELDKIIQHSINYDVSMDFMKVKSILYFMFYTGVRKGELLNLRRKDIDLEEAFAIIRVPVKNKKERKVYFPFRVSRLLKSYFLIEPEVTNAFNMTHGQLEYFFTFLKNFKKDITPHALRHAFTNMMAEKGVDIRTTQELLGHSDIRTTILYYNSNGKAVENNYRSKIK